MEDYDGCRNRCLRENGLHGFAQEYSRISAAVYGSEQNQVVPSALDFVDDGWSRLLGDDDFFATGNLEAASSEYRC